MATTQPPALPTELWIRILDNLEKDQDLPDLWTSCRHVCTSFREAAESIFRNKHLPKTWIRFHLGTYYDDDDVRLLLHADFNLSHLSEDKSKAFFQIKECPDEHKLQIRKRLLKCVQNMDIEMPQHSIHIYWDVNDTPIPGLTIDSETFEVSCNWRELYTIFYGEEQLYHTLCGAWVKNQGEWTLNLKAKLDRGEIDMVKMMEQAVNSFASGSDESRRTARRARIRRQFKELDGTEWDADRDGDVAEEKKALKNLADARFVASLEEHSDDDGSEGEFEEGASDDDWEDEDDSDAVQDDGFDIQ